MENIQLRVIRINKLQTFKKDKIDHNLLIKLLKTYSKFEVV